MRVGLPASTRALRMASLSRLLKPCFSSARVMPGKVPPCRAASGYCRLLNKVTDSSISIRHLHGRGKSTDGPVTHSMTWQKHSLVKVIEQIPIGVAVALPGGTIEYANPCLRRLLGLDTAQSSKVDLAQFRVAGTVPPREEIRQSLLAGLSWQGETQFRTEKGEARHVLESVYPLYDETGTIPHFVHFLQDIVALKYTEMLSGLAFYDSLTGLPNRFLFNDRLVRAS